MIYHLNKQVIFYIKCFLKTLKYLGNQLFIFPIMRLHLHLYHMFINTILLF